MCFRPSNTVILVSRLKLELSFHPTLTIEGGWSLEMRLEISIQDSLGRTDTGIANPKLTRVHKAVS